MAIDRGGDTEKHVHRAPTETNQDAGLSVDELRRRLAEARAEIVRLNAELGVCQEGESKYRMMIEYAYEGAAIITGTQVVFCNARLAEMAGCSLEVLMGSEIWDYIHPADADFIQERLSKARTDAVGPMNYRCRIVTCDGEIRWVSVTPSRIVWRGEHSNLVYLTDVTEYTMVEDNLRRAHREIEMIVRSISSILISVGRDGRVDHWNRSAEEVFGLSERSVAGRLFSDCDIVWDWAQLAEVVEESRVKGSPVRINEMAFKRQDGSGGFIGMTISPISTDGTDFAGFVIIGSDISEIKVKELHASQEQKMQSIGRLAAGIAHEINTPTQYVGDNIRFLRDSFKDMFDLLNRYGELATTVRHGQDASVLLENLAEAVEAADLDYLTDQVPKAIDESLEGIARVTKIILSMKQFSHPGVEDKVMADINKALENTVTISRNEWKYVADLVMDLDPRLPLVRCLLSEINQVLLNIILNATQAISEAVGGESSERKGMIMIKTRADGAFVEIRITDTGPGIPEAVRDSIFDPFFTTKDVGKGTGQGLAIAHAVIVEKHGGSITFETESGEGTTFIIRLPVGSEG